MTDTQSMPHSEAEQEAWSILAEKLEELDEESKTQIQEAIGNWTEEFMKLMYGTLLNTYQQVQERTSIPTPEREVGSF